MHVSAVDSSNTIILNNSSCFYINESFLCQNVCMCVCVSKVVDKGSYLEFAPPGLQQRQEEQSREGAADHEPLVGVSQREAVRPSGILPGHHFLRVKNGLSSRFARWFALPTLPAFRSSYSVGCTVRSCLYSRIMSLGDEYSCMALHGEYCPALAWLKTTFTFTY